MKKTESPETIAQFVATARNEVPPGVRQMQRDDRRIIFEKLNEVYLDEKQGYASPWTDDKVSKDLGVPRAWVSNVREEMFGPIATNSSIEEALKAVREVTVEIAKHREQGEKLAMAANSLLKQMDTIIKAVGGK